MAAVLEDVEIFKKSGGGTIVENSNHGLQRNISLMKEISKSTGINVIAGTGRLAALVNNDALLCRYVFHIKRSIKISFFILISNLFYTASLEKDTLNRPFIIISFTISLYYKLYFCKLLGYYVAAAQSTATLGMFKEEMYNLMHKELEIGCVEYPDVKAGFIGEIGSTWPIEGKST
jgi:predicted metal-dependent phosphotriesterase family hydrolase